jgi:hypothetical protein
VPIISPSGGGGGVISGVTITGTATAGMVPVATNSTAGTWTQPPAFEYGYDQITGTVNVASTTEATPTTIISCAAHTFDGSVVMVMFYAPFIKCGAAVGESVIVSLWEGVTQIGRLGTHDNNVSTVQDIASTMWFRFTPTAASHTYTVTAVASSVSGTPAIGAGAGGANTYPPCFVRFTKA